MPLERLQKLIARAGVASRRRAEQLIVAGRVRVNGKIVTTLGAMADLERDRIEVDNRRLRLPPPVTYVLYKPRGVVTTLFDPEGRRTVLDFMRAVRTRVFPVGRLDYNTSGALLLTSDGELAHGLLHPRHHVPRVYRVKVQGRVSDEVLQRWAQGVEVDGRLTKPARVSKLREEGDNTWLSLTLYEGRNRQVQRMCEVVGLRLRRLVRFSFAGITIEGMRPGEYRRLNRSEIAMLRRFVARPDPRTRLPPPPSHTEEPVPEDLRGEEDDGTWSAWQEGTIWELFEPGAPAAAAGAPVAEGVVRRAATCVPAGEASLPPAPEHRERPRWSGRLPGRYEETDELEDSVPKDEPRGATREAPTVRERAPTAGGESIGGPLPPRERPPSVQVRHSSPHGNRPDDRGGPAYPRQDPDRPFRRRKGTPQLPSSSSGERAYGSHPPRDGDRPHRRTQRSRSKSRSRTKSTNFRRRG